MRWRYAVLILSILNIYLLGVIAVPWLKEFHHNFTHVLFNEPVIGYVYGPYSIAHRYVQVGPRHFLYGLFDLEFARARTMLRLLRDDIPFNEWRCLREYASIVWVCLFKVAHVDGMIFIRSLDIEGQFKYGWVYARDFDPLWEFGVLRVQNNYEFNRLQRELEESEEHAWINMYELDGVTVIASVKRASFTM